MASKLSLKQSDLNVQIICIFPGRMQPYLMHEAKMHENYAITEIGVYKSSRNIIEDRSNLMSAYHQQAD